MDNDVNGKVNEYRHHCQVQLNWLIKHFRKCFGFGTIYNGKFKTRTFGCFYLFDTVYTMYGLSYNRIILPYQNILCVHVIDLKLTFKLMDPPEGI